MFATIVKPAAEVLTSNGITEVIATARTADEVKYLSDDVIHLLKEGKFLGSVRSFHFDFIATEER